MTAHSLAIFLDGARVALELVVALAFLRLGRRTRDRLYGGFALAFVLLAIGDAFIGLDRGARDVSAIVFLPRLLAFVTMIATIVDKNRRARRGRP